MRQVAIICGGLSSEFDISMKSATTILSNFPKNYTCHRVVLNEQGWWLSSEEGMERVDLNDFSVLYQGKRLTFDLAITYIHGYPGEDGKVQAYLDMMNIPYLNSNPLASELSFDKWFCNQFLKNFGIPVAESVLYLNKYEHTTKEVIAQLGLPCFVKPTDSGSSYGVTMVKREEDFDAALDYAFSEGDSVVVESYLKGKEVTCGVYRSPVGIVTLPPTEIVAEGDYFDFAAKYEGKSQEITPARISASELERIHAFTKQIYSTLRLRSLARIDFILVEGQPHLVEVNTTPGFSPASIVPQQLKCAGIAIEDCFDQILRAEFPDWY
jgi:D-alanine-D-alanine ligase